MTSFLLRTIRRAGIKECKANIAGNWFIPLSALFYLLGNAGCSQDSNAFYVSAIVSFVLISAVCVLCPPFVPFFKRTAAGLRIVSLLSAFGICFCTWDILRFEPLIWGGDAFVQRTVFMFLALPFGFVFCLLFWDRLITGLKDIFQKAGVNGKEKIFILILILAYCTLVLVAYSNTNAFCHPGFDPSADRYDDTTALRDVVYTSDSADLTGRNAYILIDNAENDIRQPFFGIVSAPLMGIPSLTGWLVNKVIPSVSPSTFLAIAQVIILVISLYVLAVTLNLDCYQRAGFAAVFAGTFTYFLFSLLIEQYVVAFFCLMLTVHFLVKDKEKALAYSFASAGTLLTGGILVPFMLKREEKGAEAFIKIVERLFFYGIDFLALMLITGRTNLITGFWNNVATLSLFTGRSVSYPDRILQYLNFVGGCFLMPASAPEAMTVSQGMYNTWHLAQVSSVNIAGVVVIVLAVAGFVVKRKEKISKIALGWICFSMVMLILDKIRNGILKLVICFAIFLPMGIYNLIALSGMLRFLASQYPV